MIPPRPVRTRRRRQAIAIGPQGARHLRLDRRHVETREIGRMLHLPDRSSDHPRPSAPDPARAISITSRKVRIGSGVLPGGGSFGRSRQAPPADQGLQLACSKSFEPAADASPRSPFDPPSGELGDGPSIIRGNRSDLFSWRRDERRPGDFTRSGSEVRPWSIWPGRRPRGCSGLSRGPA